MNLPSLKEYAKHKDGTYVAFQMSEQSRDMLDHFVEMNLGLTERVDPKSYHITVIYSRTPVPTAEKRKGKIDAQAQATGYEIFNTKDGGKCLVLRVVCPKAAQMNSELKAEGATSDYPDYKAHVTIAYNFTQEIAAEDLPLPKFPLHFDEVHVSPLDPEFTPANK